ncbi:hypothetical protein Mapa_003015 [Marchantia paleacea]|nr:hypothetical protein Mapa_003015 [Marchantia paleacea]
MNLSTQLTCFCPKKFLRAPDQCVVESQKLFRQLTKRMYSWVFRGLTKVTGLVFRFRR